LETPKKPSLKAGEAGKTVFERHSARLGKDAKRVMSNVLQRAGKVQRSHNLDELPLSARLQYTSELMAEQIFESALALSTIKAKEIAVDEAAAHVFKTNLMYVREMVKLSDQLTVLGQKHRHEEELRAETVHVFSDETTALLEKARSTLGLAGVSLDADVVKDDDASD
jgi:hypothetical protein